MRTHRKTLLAGAAVVAVTTLGLSGAALAQATTTPSPSSTSTSSSGSTTGTSDGDGETADDKGGQGHEGETALTGATADKVTAAAKAKEPTATIDRVETDADGTYEAHMLRPDGTEVNVQVGADFTVTAVQTEAKEGAEQAD